MADVFGISAALAQLLSTTDELAGFIVGFAVIVALTVVLAWLLPAFREGSAFIIPVGIAVIFVVLIGWFPVWTIIFIALIVVIMVFAPFGRSSAGGLG